MKKIEPHSQARERPDRARPAGRNRAASRAYRVVVTNLPADVIEIVSAMHARSIETRDPRPARPPDGSRGQESVRRRSPDGPPDNSSDGSSEGERHHDQIA